MRVLWKLSVIVLLGVLIQCMLVRSANDIDEAAFVVRVFVARMQGTGHDNPSLVDEAQRLFQRQCARAAAAEEREAPVKTVRLAAGSDG